ncbi:TPA: hypothetical protein NG644_000671 [Vibrio parahaemolyticus]|nr:hypothetical protein [Vibrio parahaemolyticus]
MNFSQNLRVNFCEFVLKYPYIFPKKIQELGRFYDLSRNDDDELISISLFDPQLKWTAKGIHCLVQLDSQATKKLSNWLTKNEKFSERGVSLTKQRSLGASWVHLGVFTPKTNGEMFLMKQIKLNIESDYFEGCAVNFLSFCKGKIYLSMYLVCNEFTTTLLKDVDVRGMKSRDIPLTINPLNKKFGSFACNSNRGKAYEKLERNLASLRKFANNYIDNVLRELDLKKLSQYNTTISFDFFLDEARDYYSSVSKSNNEFIFLVDSFSQRNSFSLSNNKGEVMFCHLPALNLNFDNIYIRRDEGDNNEDTIRGYRDSPQHATESHNIYSFIFLFTKKYIETHKRYESILPKKKSLSNLYKNLYEVSLRLHELKRSIESFKQSARIEEYLSYRASLAEHLSKIIYDIDDFEKEIEQEKRITNELIQAENLTYHKHYSKIVFFLIIIQIVIGGLTVNWGDWIG